jgi:glycosyltransferase involved in cell wall biosynthesis
MLDLTIVIPVLNEETNLPGCLCCIGKDLVKRIVVIDSGSKDKTKEIASTFGADIIDFQWNGRFPKKRNWYLQNHRPETKWILFLDADEYMTEAFKNELKQKLSVANRTGYWLKYSIWFMGKKLKGGYPLYKLALFQVGSGEYERIDEERWSDLDMEIHEHPVIHGSIGKFKHKINHQDFRGIASYVKKHNEYAEWEARRYLASGRDSGSRSMWTWKQRLKYRFMGSVWIGPAFFFGSFILLRGFLDGRRGLAFAMLKMSYFNQIYCLIAEQRKRQTEVKA